MLCFKKSSGLPATVVSSQTAQILDINIVRYNDQWIISSFDARCVYE